MGKKEKLLKRLLSKPKDFTWDELATLLGGLGYVAKVKGKTGGSRRRFVHPNHTPIILHKPHPGNLLKRYQVDQIILHLKDEGLI